MADFYVDHGVYASALGVTPTWGVPQEGDGSTKDAAAAASIGSVLFGSVPTTGTVSVCGVSISTTGVLNAANVDAAANALASNINATTTAVAVGVAAGLPQLRNLVFARGPSGGAPAGTCQIMMRAGSDTLNHASNVNVALAQTLSPAATLTQFAGGSGGCWGWLVNPAALGVSSSIAAYTYGLFKATPIAWTASPTNLDLIYIRSGTNPTITITSAANVILSRSVATANQFASHFIVDTNRVWTGDGPNGTVTLAVNLSGSTNLTLPGVTSASNGNAQAQGGSLRCLREGNFVFQMSTSSGAVRSADLDFSVAEAQGWLYSGVLFDDVSTGTGAMQVVNKTLGTGGGSRDLGAYRFVRCTFRRVNPIANTLPLRIAPATSGLQVPAMVFEACRIEANVSGGTADPVIPLSLATGGGAVVNYGQYITFLRCKFSGWPAGNNKFELHDTAPAGLTRTQILAQDCEGLSLTAAYAGVASAGAVQDRNRSFVSIHSAAIGGAWRYENLDGVLEWNPEAAPAQPIFSATYSVHARWLATLNVVDRQRGFQLAPARLRYQGASGVKNFRQELLVSSALFAALEPGDFTATLSYVSDTTGLMVSECIETLSSSSAAWTGASGFPNHVAKALTLTTSEPVRTGCEVSVSVTLHGQPRTLVSESIFLDPEFSL